MSDRQSYIRYGQIGDENLPPVTLPSALLWDGGLLFIPLYAVTSMSLNESYHVPPVGSNASQRAAATSDDTITLSGLLVGPERFAAKLALELAAESSIRGSAVASYSNGAINGLFLVTSMTLRTDMYIQALTFGASTAKRGVIDVSLTLVHRPPPGALSALLDAGMAVVSTLASAF